MPDPAPRNFTVRSFRRADAAVCRKLYEEGLVGGRIADNDTGADIDHIQQAYMNSPGSHFWVAETDKGEVVGMIGVQQHEAEEAEIRRLRVRIDHRRRGIGTALLEEAIHFCKEKQNLKVILDTFMEREPALRLFEKFNFKLSRTRALGDKTLSYFYLDLYTPTDRPSDRIKEKK